MNKDFEPLFPEGKCPIKIENSKMAIRLKVTDKCPWQCAFCHNEGNRETASLKWDLKTKKVFMAIKKVLPSFGAIHYTGGEPTINSDLAKITAGLSSMGFEVRTTSNGQFSKETLDKLVEAGLLSFNISVNSVNPERFLKFQTGRGNVWQRKNMGSKQGMQSSKIRVQEIKNIEWAKKQINMQLLAILRVKEKNVDIRVNTVISSEADVENALEIFEWVKQNNVPWRLLKDLNNGLQSINAIRKFIEITGAQEISREICAGSSGCSTFYRTKDGYEFAFKQTRNFKLESMCKGCPRIDNGTCEEQFYGIRLQQGEDGKFYVLLCIQENRPETQMTLEEFLKSSQLKEIQSLSGTPKITAS